ncbi:MAG: AmmeMemoRadiSam system protein A [Gammaproteobacteria bacterium]|nr:AmmeMemoRadiSam system protein A [Gammaproteobacteria bacterium]
MLPEDLQRQLLIIARNSIQHGFNSNRSLQLQSDNYPSLLREIRATFVTIKIKSALRGCVGTTRAISPLILSVSDNAYSAAFHDPRFKPLRENEYKNIHISISILTPTEPIQFSSETELMGLLRPGIDGLIIEKDAFKATFLPAVWESLPEPEDFLRQLKIKARIPAYQAPVKAWRYQTDSIEET